MNDGIDLTTQLGVQGSDHVVDQTGADFLGLPCRFEQFGDECLQPLTGNGIGFIVRLDTRGFYQLIKQGK
ncbi:hypothetical protein D3C78_730220 [compost metagenome]